MAIKTDYTGDGGITYIDNKEAAYALTGVAVGTVYKTQDTGQVMERRSTLDIETSFSISDAGSPDDYIGGLDGRYQWDDANNWFQFMKVYGDNYHIRHNGTAWVLEWNGSIAVFTSPASAPTVHPADVAGAWTAGIGTGTIDGDDVTANRFYNWKHDGTILVRDNDEKQLLTNLPDGQVVEVVGEGGRIERFNGDEAGLLTSFNISDAGTPVNNGLSLAGDYTWDAASNQFGGSNYGNTVRYSAGRWKIEFFEVIDSFISDPCDSSVHPADATGWVAQWTATGTIADGGITRLPEANASNWHAIKNTVYLTVYENVGQTFDVNGVTVGAYDTDGIGWVPVGETISCTQGFNWKLREIGSSGTSSFFPAGEYMYMLEKNGDFVIPDVFVSGEIVLLENLI